MKSIKRAAVVLTAAITLATLVAGCGVAKSTKTAVTINNQSMELGFVNFVSRYQQSIYDKYYIGMFGEDMWSQDLYGNGNTFEEDVKNDVVEELELLYLYKEHAADYGIEVTADEQSKINEAAKSFMAANSSATIKEMGATEEYAVQYLTLRTIAKKAEEAIEAETAITATMEDAAQKSFTYISVYDYSHYVDGSTVEYTDEEKSEMKENLEAIAKTDDWTAAAADYGYNVLTGSYGVDDENYDASLKEALDKLKEGGVTPVVESGNYLYVGRMDSLYDEEATAAHLTQLEEAQRASHLGEVTDGWKNAADKNVDDAAIKKIKFGKIFDEASAQ